VDPEHWVLILKCGSFRIRNMLQSFWKDIPAISILVWKFMTTWNISFENIEEVMERRRSQEHREYNTYLRCWSGSGIQPLFYPQIRNP
jgi:hypothetical protein